MANPVEVPKCVGAVVSDSTPRPRIFHSQLNPEIAASQLRLGCEDHLAESTPLSSGSMVIELKLGPSAIQNKKMSVILLLGYRVDVFLFQSVEGSPKLLCYRLRWTTRRTRKCVVAE